MYLYVCVYLLGTSGMWMQLGLVLALLWQNPLIGNYSCAFCSLGLLSTYVCSEVYSHLER